MMTLMALSLVIGILIDDAVVVRENIYRHMEHGEDPVTAAQRGTSEIGLAVMATTFTILAVFLPVGFMTGIVGQFFKSFALTIAFAVFMSLLIAFTLDPMLSSRFVRYVPPEERTRTRMGRILEKWGAFYDRVDQKYHTVLGWAVRRPWAVVALAVIVFVGSLSTLGVMGTEFVPAEDRGEFVVNIEAPPGTSFEQSVDDVAQSFDRSRRSARCSRRWVSKATRCAPTCGSSSRRSSSASAGCRRSRRICASGSVPFRSSR
jgi:multidrug efflux pump subunit AcrB